VVKINFINDRELARRFKAGKVPSLERFIYFMFSVILVAAMPFYFLPAITNAELAGDVITTLFMIFGSVYLYTRNKKGDNKEFIERYVSLAFPVLIQSILVALVSTIIIISALYGVSYIPAFQKSLESMNETDAREYASRIFEDAPIILITLIFNVYFLLRMSASIKIAAGVITGAKK